MQNLLSVVRRSSCLTVALVGLAVVTSGCTALGPVNPSFPLTIEDAEAAIDSMREHPREFERPVIIVGGFLDPGLGTWWISLDYKNMTTNPDQVIRVSFYTCFSFEECRDRLIAAVDEAFPSTDKIWTIEVDVIAMSMGGITSRLAAAPPKPGTNPGRRLRIARLFTLSSPHRGANLAGIQPFHPLQIQMRYGSDTLLRIDRAYRDRDYEVYPYVRLDDFVVGAGNAAPHGEDPWWLSNGTFNLAHVAGCIDPRPNADIARRLRGEPAYATRPAAPIPIAAAPDFIRRDGEGFR